MFARFARLLALLALLFAAPAAAQTTAGPTAIACNAWTSLGAGPLTVTLRSGPAVWIAASAAAPADAAGVGHPLGLTDPLAATRDFDVSQTLWARASNCSQAPAQIVVTTGRAATVGGKTNVVCVTPTITASTYASGQQIGGLLTFANLFGPAGSGIVQSVSISSPVKQTTAMIRFYPIVGNPNATTWTDRATPAIAAADVIRVRPPYDLTTPYTDLGTHTVWGLYGLGHAINAGSSTLWGVLVATSAHAAYGSTSDIRVCVTALVD